MKIEEVEGHLVEDLEEGKSFQLPIGSSELAAEV